MLNVWLFVIFQGTELEFSGLAIEFRVDTAKTTYCQVFTLYQLMLLVSYYLPFPDQPRPWGVEDLLIRGEEPLLVPDVPGRPAHLGHRRRDRREGGGLLHLDPQEV